MAILIPYVKQTWTDGSGGGTPVSAARLGVLEEGILDVSLAPAVRVFHNAAQSITTAVTTALAFNSERYDQAGGVSAAHHDTATNNSRLTCLYAGVYQISAGIEWQSGATGYRNCFIRLNGSTPISPGCHVAAIASLNMGQNQTTQYALAVNDYVELMVLHTQGAGLNVTVQANYSPEFSMVRVG